jgi:hypothetical protein
MSVERPDLGHNREMERAGARVQENLVESTREERRKRKGFIPFHNFTPG